jgi:hypothetical protein
VLLELVEERRRFMSGPPVLPAIPSIPPFRERQKLFQSNASNYDACRVATHCRNGGTCVSSGSKLLFKVFVNVVSASIVIVPRHTMANCASSWPISVAATITGASTRPPAIAWTPRAACSSPVTPSQWTSHTSTIFSHRRYS